MKNFVCSNCGNTIKRPSAPLKCEACGQQRVGLFKTAGGAAPAAPSRPATTIAPPPPPVGSGDSPAAPPQPPRPQPAVPAAGGYKPAPLPAGPKPAALPPGPKPTAPSPPAAKPQPSAPAAKAAPQAPAPARSAPAAPSKPAAPTKPAARAPGYRLDDDDAPPASIPGRSASPAGRAPSSAARSPSPAYAPEAPRKSDHQVVTTATPGGPGSLVWRYPEWLPGQGVALAALRNCPAADGKGRVYAAVGSLLSALAEEDGQLRTVWEYKTGGHIPGSPSLGRDGKIRVHSNDGKLHCVSPEGQAAWTPVAVGEPLGWASPLVDTDDYTWICAYAGGLLKVDPRGIKGNPAYYRTRQKFDSTGLIHDGSFFVGTEDGFVYAIDLKGHRGKLTWDPLAGHGKTDWFINSAPAQGAGGLIVAGRDEHLYAFRFEGTQLWELHLRGQMLSSPVVDEQGDIYVCVCLEQRGEPASGKLVCVTGDPPRIKWEYRAHGAIESTPVVGNDGLIYFGDNAGVVHCVSRDGRAEWTQSVGAAVRSAGTIPAPNRLVFGNDDGILTALLCSSEGLAPGGWPKYMRNLAQCAAP